MTPEREDGCPTCGGMGLVTRGGAMGACPACNVADPSPDSHKPAAPEPARWVVEECKTSNWVLGRKTASSVEDERRVRVLGHSQPCPVTVQELRDAADALAYSDWPGYASQLRAVADWLGGQQQ